MNIYEYGICKIIEYSLQSKWTFFLKKFKFHNISENLKKKYSFSWCFLFFKKWFFLQKSRNAANLAARLDPNILPSGRCLNETAIWLASLVDFMNAIGLNCAMNDTQCEAIQGAMIEQNIFAVKRSFILYEI